MTLSARFEELARGATKGPVKVDTQTVIPMHSAMTYGLPRTEGIADSIIADYFTVEDAEFYAFCGTNRAALLAALKVAEAVDRFERWRVSIEGPNPPGVVMPDSIFVPLHAYRSAVKKEGSEPTNSGS